MSTTFTTKKFVTTMIITAVILVIIAVLSFHIGR